MPPCTPFLRPLAAVQASRRRSGAAHWSDAGFEGAQWSGAWKAAQASRRRSGEAQWSGAWKRRRLRGSAVERRGNFNPRQGMAAVRSPVFRHAGAWRHAGNEIPQQNRTPEVVRSRATTSPGMLGCATRGRGDMRGAGIADISRNACRRYAPRSLHAHPSQPFYRNY